MQTNDIKSTSDYVHEFEWYNTIPGYFTGICKIKSDKSIRYYKDGKLHREDGPAVEYADGTKYWYKDNQYHREDGPAIEYVDGDKYWFINGKRHREDGPAIELADGTKYWFQYGKKHRIDGPAVEVGNYKRYWIDDIEYPEKEFHKKTKNMNAIKFENFFDIKNDFTGIAEVNGSISYYKDGQFHREDGPAVEHPDGTKLWYVNGLCHRMDGPAIEYSNGQKDWWVDNKRHRLDGPAIEYADGTKFYWIEGNEYSEEEFNKKILEMEIETFKNLNDIPKDFTGVCKVLSAEIRYYKDGKIHRENGPAITNENGYEAWYVNNQLHREDGPAVKYSTDSKYWYQNGVFHRTDGPAVELADGRKEWIINGKRHRTDGPAIERANGTKEWWIDDVRYYTEKEFNDKIKPMSMIEFSSISNVPCDFTGVCKINNQTRHFKDGKTHNENGPAIEYDGNKFWVQNNRYHREDGPACEYVYGKKEWRINGNLHRLDGPAIEYEDGTKNWFIEGLIYNEKEFNDKILEMNTKKFEKQTDVPLDFTGICNIAGYKQICYKDGKCHRTDGPAVVYTDDTKEWWIEGKLHREDGPAIQWADGTKWWYKNDQLHREDGPAKEYPSGLKYWYIDGVSYFKNQFDKKMLDKNIKTFKTQVDVPDNFNGICRILAHDETHYYKDGVLHREEGPAVEYASGTKQWWLNGKLHREGGPAKEYSNGAKSWFTNGALHRLDGPAIEHVNKYKEYWIEDKKYSEEQFNAKIASMNIHEFDYITDIPLYFTGICKIHNNGETHHYKEGKLHCENGPAVEHENGYKAWYVNGKRHRIDGPAVENSHGTKHWYQNGKHHRTDGPAIEYSNGEKEWWIEGKQFSEKDLTIIQVSNALYVPSNFTGVCKILDLNEIRYYKNRKLHREDGPAIEHANGDKQWFLNGKSHRTDGPAIEKINGEKEWSVNGLLHRIDGPAIEHTDGYKAWYKDGQRHRTDGPAIERPDGDKFWWIEGEKYSEQEFNKKIQFMNIKNLQTWNDLPSKFTGFCRLLSTKENYHFKNGERHREDGPAVEADNGYKAWYLNNKRHRIDGPAIEYANGNKKWYIDNVEYSEADFNSKIFEMNMKEFNYDSIPKDFTGVCKIKHDQSTRHYKDGQLHRENGPAIEFANGSKEWHLNGKLHRENGPAFEGAKGDKTWYINGLLHREDGPAFESKTNTAWYKNGLRHRLDGPAVEIEGGKEWWIEGEEYSEEEFNNYNNKNKVIEFYYIGDVPPDFTGIAKVSSLQETYYFKDGKKHREDGPATESTNGYKAWWINGKKHRLDGPAVEWVGDNKQWWIEGEKYSEEEFTKKAAILNAKEFKNLYFVPKDFTGVCKIKRDKSTCYYKDGKLHREDGPAVEYEDGNKHWFINDQRHREDGPAVEYANGNKVWFINGKRHRENGPAIEWTDGTKEWWLNDYRHRDNGPAIEYADGHKQWYLNSRSISEDYFNKCIKAISFKTQQDIPKDFTGACRLDTNELFHYKNGVFHSEDGPAYENMNGDKVWHINGKRHRLDGPAYESASFKSWWIDGKEYSKKEDFDKIIKDMQIQEFEYQDSIPEKFTGICRILASDETHYYKDGELHREDGPAIEGRDGYKAWFINDKRHRTDGPAIEGIGYKHWYVNDKLHREDGPAFEDDDNGTKKWYLNHQLHREDGPAVEYVDGQKEWYVNDKRHREDGPAIEYADGSTKWFKNGFSHRTDGPAVEYVSGAKQWWIENKLHRIDGPAVERADGKKEWWIDGKNYLEEEFNSLTNNKKIKSLFNEASHRIIAEQCMSTIRALLIKLISMNSSLRNAELIMNSEVGKALLQSALGIVIYKTQDNEFLSKIGYELLTSSIANFENNIISHAINYEVNNQIRIDDSISITSINSQENTSEEYEDILIDCSDFEELCL